MTVAYRAARVIGELSEHAIESGVVLVEDGRVLSLGPAVGLPPAVRCPRD